MSRVCIECELFRDEAARGAWVGGVSELQCKELYHGGLCTAARSSWAVEDITIVAFLIGIIVGIRC